MNFTKFQREPKPVRSKLSYYREPKSSRSCNLGHEWTSALRKIIDPVVIQPTRCQKGQNQQVFVEYKMPGVTFTLTGRGVVHGQDELERQRSDVVLLLRNTLRDFSEKILAHGSMPPKFKAALARFEAAYPAEVDGPATGLPDEAIVGTA